MCILAAYNNRSWKLVIQKKDIPYSLLAGFFLALHFATWTTSLSYTTISSAAILSSTQPLYISFFGWLLLKESISPREIIALLISFAGAIILGGGDMQLGSRAIWGDLLAMMSGAFSAGYFLAGRKLRIHIELTNYLTVVYTSAAICLGIMALLVKNPFAPYPGSVWFWLLMLIIFPTMTGHSMYNWALKYFSAHKVGMASFIEPVFTSLLAYLIFKEAPALGTYLGGLLIFTGLYISMFTGNAPVKETTGLLE